MKKTRLDIKKEQEQKHYDPELRTIPTTFDEIGAIEALYEELYDSANAINKDTIFEAMAVLLEHFKSEKLEEMEDLGYEDICVEHKKVVTEKAIDAFNAASKEMDKAFWKNFRE